ncbi:MAG: hypothetical protein LC739_12270 [Actinobacteria bacterium]|nr:hypothetical protein [Actinomycetota bacterium]
MGWLHQSGIAAAGLMAAFPVDSSRVLLIDIEGAITPVVADFVTDAVEQVGSGGYQALVVTIDTPGGLDLSMREIVQALLNSTTPTVVYVSPEGARAASASTFITMAAHITAMSPASSIGAATPVDLQGGEITDKIINDAVAFGVSVAERRGRGWFRRGRSARWAVGNFSGGVRTWSRRLGGGRAIIYEAANPGLGFSGIAGVISREDAVPGGRIFGYAV